MQCHVHACKGQWAVVCYVEPPPRAPVCMRFDKRGNLLKRAHDDVRCALPDGAHVLSFCALALRRCVASAQP